MNQGSGLWSSSPITLGTHPFTPAGRPVDVDGDGDLDILARRGYSLVLLEDVGGLTYAQHVLDTDPPLNSYLKPMDFDGDGDLDFLVDARASYWSEGPYWLENRGLSDFVRQPSFLTRGPVGFSECALADFDDDGFDDLVYSGGDFDFALVRGTDHALTGAALAPDPIVLSGRAPGASGMLAIDLDGDGDDDLLTFSPLGERTRAINVAGRFKSPEPLDLALTEPIEEAVAVDLDRDGDEDLLVLTRTSRYGWLANDGSGAFGPLVPIATSAFNESTPPVLLDIEGDGDLDVIVDRFNGLSLHVQTSPGVFGPGALIASLTADVTDLLALDFDADGDTDLAALEVPTAGGSGLLTLYQRVGPAAFARRVLTDAGPSPRDLFAFQQDPSSDLPELGWRPGVGSRIDYLPNFPGACLCERVNYWTGPSTIRSVEPLGVGDDVTALAIALQDSVEVIDLQASGTTTLRIEAVDAMASIDANLDGDADLLAVDGSLGVIYGSRSRAAGTGGDLYCNLQSVNSTGATAGITVHRLPQLPQGFRFRLRAFDVPPHVPVMFLASRSSGFSPGAGGSAGTLCLGQSIGRLNGPGQIRSSGPDGFVAMDLGRCEFPSPSGPVCYQPGQNWYFQAWYRDPTNGTSNFTAAVLLH